MSPEELQRLHDGIQGRARSDQVGTGEYLVRKRTGEPLTVAVSAARLNWPGAALPVVLVAMRDVTETRRVEQLKSDFISTVSHELRTPLTGIIGYSSMLRESGGADPAQREVMARRVQEKAVELQSLIEQLLEAASLQAGATELSLVRTDVRALLHEVAEAAFVPEGVRLELVVSGRMPKVMVDRARIAQALESLLSNAFKYSPDGGRVELGAQREGDDLVLWVRDRGIGMDAAQVAAIFDRFTQVDHSSTRSFGGLGLGLYTARQIAEAHGGRIEVESEPGEGSTFSISLPAFGA
jgi:two-component system phosphate regulon sensor histidine kinase PhoR